MAMLPRLLSPLGFNQSSMVGPLFFPSVVIGIALLVTLPFGNEFQHRTLSVLLAQPIGRMEIWAEKFTVMIIAVLSAALVYFISWHGAFERDPELSRFAGGVLITMIGSATFWTL